MNRMNVQPDYMDEDFLSVIMKITRSNELPQDDHYLPEDNAHIRLFHGSGMGAVPPSAPVLLPRKWESSKILCRLKGDSFCD